MSNNPPEYDNFIATVNYFKKKNIPLNKPLWDWFYNMMANRIKGLQ